MKYSLIHKDTLEWIKTKDHGDTTPPVFSQESKPWVWVPFTRAPLPSFDPATEVREPDDVVISLTEHTITEQKRLKTQAELDAEIEADKDGQIQELDAFKVVLKAMLNHENRIRALEGKQPVTVGQFKSALRGLL